MNLSHYNFELEDFFDEEEYFEDKFKEKPVIRKAKREERNQENYQEKRKQDKSKLREIKRNQENME